MTVLPPISERRSPNQSQRTHGNDAVDLIIVHTPEGGFESAIRTCLDPDRPPEEGGPVSYHTITREDGSEAVQLVHFDRKAWHAGVQNSRSEGHALAGFAASTFPWSQGGRTLARIVAARLRARGFPPKWRSKGEVGGGYCRHADVQSNRRDPMPLVRWTAFRALVTWEYRRGSFRERWGFGVPDRILD